MRKGKTADTLTGGTGDVNPQVMILPSVTLQALNTYYQVQMPLPVSQIPVRNGKAIVMEILKVFFDVPSPAGNVFTTTGTVVQAQMQIATASVSSIQHNAGNVITFISRKWQGNAGTTPYAMTWFEPDSRDLTDGAGHGVLIATNSLYIGADTSNWNANPTFNARLLYRWKEVGLIEYLGMVQSQQTPGALSGS